ncbi:amidohydrolase family protein [Agromyces silvae]|uniref:amidohydrolase family protein n=1 Tax=Agromyces silvae TaxID=3388266 RepID=UPI00280BCB54|nr:amidohydrolase family protein [Agromyces protaetiae]
MTRRDAHVHLSRRTGFSAALEGHDEVDTYDRARTDAGVVEALVVGYERDGHRGNNAEILELSRTRPWLRPLAFLETQGPPDAMLLHDGLDMGYAGWAVYLDRHAFRRWPHQHLAALGRGGGVLSVNVGMADLDGLADGLRLLPEVPVLVSHLGLPGADGNVDALVALAADARVHVKLSGLYAIDPTLGHAGAREPAERLIEAFGPGRVHWGSDFSPVLDVAPDSMQLPDWLPSVAGDHLDAILGDALGDLLQS